MVTVKCVSVTLKYVTNSLMNLSGGVSDEFSLIIGYFFQRKKRILKKCVRNEKGTRFENRMTGFEQEDFGNKSSVRAQGPAGDTSLYYLLLLKDILN